ncbi:hypothetical protein [Synechocystis sp. LKSZ1]|uniref:hypothetical protein n=1 Tax=Synechocystis sp. LKSZ1 TaxID=3144951 RepID=UPI00336C130C
MSNINELLEETLNLDGALLAALGDWKTGMCLASVGTDNPRFPLKNAELAVAGNTQVIRTKLKVAASLGMKEKIDDILITLETQYHLMSITHSFEGLFFYLALDRDKGNLALARMKLRTLEPKLVI